MALDLPHVSRTEIFALSHFFMIQTQPWRFSAAEVLPRTSFLTAWNILGLCVYPDHPLEGEGASLCCFEKCGLGLPAGHRASPASYRTARVCDSLSGGTRQAFLTGTFLLELVPRGHQFA